VKIFASLSFIVVLFALGLCVVSSLAAQDSTSYDVRKKSFFTPEETAAACGSVVDTVIIQGNFITKDFIIRREMTFGKGDTLKATRIVYNRDRIYGLALFNDVVIRANRTNGYTAVVVDVDERWYWFPYPLAGLKERNLSTWLQKPTLDKAFFGAGLRYNNFRGRNETISTEFAIGYDPYVKFAYTNPYLTADGVGGSFSFGYSQRRNTSVDINATDINFEQTIYSAGVSIYDRLTLFQTIGFGAGFMRLSVPAEVTEQNSGATVSKNGTDAYPYLSLSYSYNTINLPQYPTLGTYLSLGFTRNGFSFTKDEMNFHRMTVDARLYRKLLSVTPDADLTIAVRNLTAISFDGRVPDYQHLQFGYGTLLRGHAFEVLEGDNLQMNSIELRYPLFPYRTQEFGFVPVDQFRVMRYAVYISAFVDTGILWYNATNPEERQTNPFSWARFVSGYGVGICLVGPYNLTARIDVARNERDKIDVVLSPFVSF
jgi:outer membrane protein assembly factor BamA